MFDRVGHLPIAVSIAAALIRDDPRYEIAGLLKDLPEEVTELIQQAIAALDAAPRKLLSAMAACAPEGFGLDLAAEVAGIDSAADSLEALRQLVTRSLAEEVDRDDRRYRLLALVREAAADRKTLAPVHARAVAQRFEAWEENWRRCEQDLPDFRVALDWGLMQRSAPESGFDGQLLAYYGYALASRIGRPTEALETCERMRGQAEVSGDLSWLQAWLGNQALILKAWGRLDDALALHKKEEAICLEPGNKDGLQRSYGNQANILVAWGRLDDALAPIAISKKCWTDLSRCFTPRISGCWSTKMRLPPRLRKVSIKSNAAKSTHPKSRGPTWPGGRRSGCVVVPVNGFERSTVCINGRVSTGPVRDLVSHRLGQSDLADRSDGEFIRLIRVPRANARTGSPVTRSDPAMPYSSCHCIRSS